MTRKREKNLLEMTRLFSLLENNLQGDRAIRHLNSNIQLEPFFRDLLNLVFGWKLKDANASKVGNQKAYDLCDEQNKIAVQVTGTEDAKKIRDTLKKFIGEYDDKFDRLCFAYPKIEIKSSKADFSNDLGDFKFDAQRDRLSLGTILKQAHDMPIEEQSNLLKFLKKELGTLDKKRTSGLVYLKCGVLLLLAILTYTLGKHDAFQYGFFLIAILVVAEQVRFGSLRNGLVTGAIMLILSVWPLVTWEIDRFNGFRVAREEYCKQFEINSHDLKNWNVPLRLLEAELNRRWILRPSRARISAAIEDCLVRRKFVELLKSGKRTEARKLEKQINKEPFFSCTAKISSQE